MVPIADGGVNIEFESVGIRTVVPANALPPGQAQLVKITVITDVTKFMKISTDEILVAFGIQCLPDGLQLRAPVTVTIPHCMVLDQTDEISPILYAGHGEIGMLHSQGD